jgi:hypothetical protein
MGGSVTPGLPRPSTPTPLTPPRVSGSSGSTSSSVRYAKLQDENKDLSARLAQLEQALAGNDLSADARTVISNQSSRAKTRVMRNMGDTPPKKHHQRKHRTRDTRGSDHARQRDYHYEPERQVYSGPTRTAQARHSAGKFTVGMLVTGFVSAFFLPPIAPFFLTTGFVGMAAYLGLASADLFRRR